MRPGPPPASPPERRTRFSERPHHAASTCRFASASRPTDVATPPPACASRPEPRALARLKALADRPNATPAETKETNALLKAARLTSVVVLVSPDGHSQTLWSALTDDKDGGPTDLAWSPDGAWLAIARRDGTVRLAAE